MPRAPTTPAEEITKWAWSSHHTHRAQWRAPEHLRWEPTKGVAGDHRVRAMAGHVAIEVTNIADRLVEAVSGKVAGLPALIAGLLVEAVGR